MLAVNMIQQLAHPFLVKGTENHSYDTGERQPAAGRTLDIPRGRQSIDSRTREQSDRNFMPSVKIQMYQHLIGNLNGKYG